MAQEKDSTVSYVNPKRPTKNTIYAGILGNGILISTLNYERILICKEPYQITARIGGVYYFHRRNEDVTPWSVPFELTLALGSKHHLDLGTGLTYIYGLYCVDCSNGYNKKSASSTLYSSIRVGYKYKKEDGHLFLSLAFTPVIRIREYNTNYVLPHTSDYNNEQIIPTFGLGAGYSL